MEKRVMITRPMIGICYMQVCAISDATDEEILEVANAENPSGTTNGWSQVAREDYEDERGRPVVCEDDKNRKHFMLIC
jgi:hypothetical protein